jgi:hypothetical protein
VESETSISQPMCFNEFAAFIGNYFFSAWQRHLTLMN